MGLDTLFLKPAFRDTHAFRGDALALQVFRTGDRGVFRNHQHPAGGLGSCLLYTSALALLTPAVPT